MREARKIGKEPVDKAERLRIFAHVVDQTPTSTIILDKDLIIEYVNRACAEVTGYARDELIGKHVNILRSDEHTPEFYESIWTTARSGKAWRGDVCNRRKNGEKYWELIRVSPVKGPGGEITRFLSIKVDDPERRRAEAALKKERDYLKKLHDSLGEAVLTVTLPDMLIESANPSVKYLFDYEPEDCVGRKMETLFSKGAFEGFSRKLKATMESEDERLCTEHMLERKNNDIFPAGVTTSFFRVDGKITRIISIIRDITERKGG